MENNGTAGVVRGNAGRIRSSLRWQKSYQQSPHRQQRNRRRKVHEINKEVMRYVQDASPNVIIFFAAK